MEPVVEELVQALAKLPGLGTRSAERAALALLRKPEKLADPLVAALTAARREVLPCPVCGGWTLRGKTPCSICSDPLRDESLLCVVEEPADVQPIERSGAFKGKYHVLMGRLSPARLAAGSLRIEELVARVSSGVVKEVLLATGTDMEGDATAAWVAERLSASGVRVTRLAFGLPAGSGVGYSDPLTLKRAINARNAF